MTKSVQAANGPARMSSTRTRADHHFLLPSPRSGSKLQALGDEPPATSGGCQRLVGARPTANSPKRRAYSYRSVAVAGAATEPLPITNLRSTSSYCSQEAIDSVRAAAFPCHLADLLNSAKMLAAGFIELKFDCLETKDLPIGHVIFSELFSAGGHLWRVQCYPRGAKEEYKGEYVSIFLMLVSESENVEAFFDVCLLTKDGLPSLTDAMRRAHVFVPNTAWGWLNFVKRSHLVPSFLTNGIVRFMCGVIVVPGDPTPMPPPDIGMNLGGLLDSAVGSDVSFIVDGETFPAHRAVLAARSPVFKAEFFGSMADATMSTVMLQDIEPEAFKVMLRFMYTDSFPADKELGDSITDMLQHLLAAADRYALDRLKLICSRKLIGHISVDTVGSILVFAETYNCPELKNKCLDFFAVEKNFKEAAFSDGFTMLLQKFPSLAAELRRRVTGQS